MDIKNIFGKVQELRNLRADDDDDLLESAVSDDDYEDSRKPNKFSSGIFDDEEETPVNSFASFNYSPTAALPDFGGGENFTPLKGIDEIASESAPASNVYDMNSSKVRSNAKFKLTFISLHDIYDAKNVANIMIDQNAMVVVNLGLLSDEQKRRAMDFLDGAKYVTNSIFTRFTENICAFLPEGVELHGDFYGQVDIDNLGSF